MPFTTYDCHMVPLTPEEINGLLNDDLAMTTTALKAHPKRHQKRSILTYYSNAVSNVSFFPN